MKIWIITSGSESLTLFKFLSKYDHEYVVYYDFFHRPYGDKTFAQSRICIEKGIEYLTKQGVDTIIVPPIYELHYLASSLKLKAWSSNILPLFTTYLKNYCFTYSLVGKIGFFGDFVDVSEIENLVKKFAKWYALTSHQQAIKKFHFPFVYWIKETPLWKYYLNSLSYSHILVNKIIKFDLRYFKDAMVDTLVPLNYGYFNYQTTITKFLNFKNIRFHTLEKLENIFHELVPSTEGIVKNKYSVIVAYTGHVDILKREKRMIWLLQRGKSIEVEFKEV
jgi:hypothetical protein